MKSIFKPFVQFYLKFLTKFVLWRHKPLVIAVAGTTNKTFIKDVILEQLGAGAAAEDVRGNPKSFNTEIGLPLAVLYLPSGYSSVFRWVDVLLTGACVSVFSRKFPKVLVLEMGVDRRGDMSYLLSMVKPTIAVLTTVRGDFSENKATLDDIATELGGLVRAIPFHGSVILNGEDQRVRRLKSKARSKVIVHGKGKKCDAQIQSIADTQEGQKFSFVYEGETVRAETQRRGRHNVNALVVAKIVVSELERIQKSAKQKNDLQ